MSLVFGTLPGDHGGLVRLHRLDDARAIFVAARGREFARHDLVIVTLELLQPVQAMAQIAAGARKVEPVVDVIREARHKLLVHHCRRFAEIGHVLASVTARLGDKVAEVLHQVGAHRLLSDHFRAGDGLPELRVDILLAAAELQEERLVVDARRRRSSPSS
jgi:hypothetical protein